MYVCVRSGPGYSGVSVKEIYNERYDTLCNEEIDCISVRKEND